MVAFPTVVFHFSLKGFFFTGGQRDRRGGVGWGWGVREQRRWRGKQRKEVFRVYFFGERARGDCG